MSKHIGFPNDRLVLEVEVLEVVEQETDFGPISLYTLRTKDGDILFWKATRNSNPFDKGRMYKVKASVRNHDTTEDGVKRTIVSHVVEYKEPYRIPRVAVGFARRR